MVQIDQHGRNVHHMPISNHGVTNKLRRVQVAEASFNKVLIKGIDNLPLCLCHVIAVPVGFQTKL